MQFQENEGEGSFSSSSSMEESPGSSGLGLTLRKSPSFINLLETKLAEASQRKRSIKDFIAPPMSEKLKASNFPASLLEIGSWRRISKNEGNLTSKLYYAKRKLVWEVLEGALKSKIEVQWSDISAIRACTLHNGNGMLEIQLNQPPSFFRETNPQPRKHTIWQPSQDFTGGQASICRNHVVYFPPGALDRHYEKLLQYDLRLFDLSKKPFPSQDHPYFCQNPYGFSNFLSDINGYLPEFSHAQHDYPVQNFLPANILPPHPNSFKQSTDSPMSVMDSLFMDEGGSSYAYENQWGDQGVNNHFQGLDSISMATIKDNEIQNYNLSYGEELSGMNNPNNTENHLLLGGDTQAACLDEMSLLMSYNSMYPLLDLQQAEANTIQWLPPQQVSYDEFNINSSMNMSMYQHARPCQISDDGMNVNSSMNMSMYPYKLPEPTMDDFAPMSAQQNTHHWN